MIAEGDGIDDPVTSQGLRYKPVIGKFKLVHSIGKRVKWNDAVGMYPGGIG